MTLTPEYKLKSIGSIDALAFLLDLPLNRVQYLANNASDLYRVARIEQKKSGGQRVTYDAYKVLKAIHRKLQHQIFKKVIYPQYMQGSISGRSYITNVRYHTKCKIVICEDISNFFPTIQAVQVEKMFMRLFRFPLEVAKTLTNLVTLNGSVPQGGICSSYIANLVMWEKESILVSRLLTVKLTYTRYVDDITVSSKSYMTKQEISEVIASIYGMLRYYGVEPNKSKHEVLGNGSHQAVHRVGVNGNRPSFGKEEKKKIRSAVHNLSTLFSDDKCTYEAYLREFSSVSSQVGKLQQLNEYQGKRYRGDLNTMKPSIKRFNLG
ncbi:reverse transcriptase [Shewanella hanedai]|uniref:RNA-directed DNA polymerase n=1 Tax=Shewanella hanedai TaxID=25 RepID=A0A553JQC0_SHEHA|nr:reverse transcriptase family protein [Shewanella hanedai]TRY14628.1 RNA-directed DNA polymerase [Shewanella hanedai]GGI77498.1 reverse transcriptase [Shewanella hanedai]